MRFLTLAILFFMVLSCKEKLIEPPEDLIPQEKMTEILYDLALLKGLQITSNTAFDKYDIETMPYLFNKYDIDSIQFVASDEYYASVPSIYQVMYTEIQNRLEDQIQIMDKARERKTDSTRARTKRVRDSLKKRASSNIPKPVPSEK